MTQAREAVAPDPPVAAIVREQAGVSWSRARRLCEEGRVTVDGARRLDPASRVAPGMTVVVDQHAPKLDTRPLATSAIVFCDRDVVVVDKPAGMLTVADEAGNKDTLADYTRMLIGQLRKPGDDMKLGVVHRQDKETSGVMIFARTPHAKRVLAAQFFDHTVERAYRAIAHGIVNSDRVDTHLMLERGDGLHG